MYIHQYTAVAPLATAGDAGLDTAVNLVDGKLIALETSLEGVPPSMLRRMSKAVRMGLGAGLPLLRQQEAVAGIVIGTANGGMEDCIKFLNQIVDYEEGLLTPGNFVQSTPNAIAGQLSLITRNRGYNATHVHKGLAFENALIDAAMLVREYPQQSYIVGGVDEISTYNYNIDYLAGWYDKVRSPGELYQPGVPATIAGEGAAMFLVNDRKPQALASLEVIDIFHSDQPAEVQARLNRYLQAVAGGDTLLLSGENGDSRHQPFYDGVASLLPANFPVLRFKHLCGEYPTAASFGVWLGCRLLNGYPAGQQLIKSGKLPATPKSILLYNQYQGQQHSLIRLEALRNGS